MGCCNAYESDSMKDVMGLTLRPGGFTLTEKGVEFCKISSGDSVLDLGCGRGATVDYLNNKFQLKAVGIDPSEKLIGDARVNYINSEFVIGKGERLPFNDESFHAVFAECTLSLMDDLEATISEVYRVLKKDGWFVITDVYAKNPEAVSNLNTFSFDSCMRGLHDLESLKKVLTASNLGICMLEDHSHLLKALLVNIGFSYGSMGAFWNITTDNCINGCKFQEALRLCKPGYFIMIARKSEAL